MPPYFVFLEFLGLRCRPTLSSEQPLSPASPSRGAAVKQVVGEAVDRTQLCALIKQAIPEAQEKGGRRPFTPAFWTVGDELITFHDLEAEDGIFAPVIDRGTDAKE
jgi:hypothetical protein